MIKTTKVHNLTVLIPLETVTSLVHPARIRERVWNELLGCELWPVVISLANTYTADPKLAGNTRRAERAIIRMHHIAQRVGKGASYGSWLDARCAHDGGLSWTITVDESRYI